MPSEEHHESLLEDLEKIIVSEDAIRHRLDELAAEITSHYDGKDLVVIAIINGAVIFVADLIRRIKLPLQFDCIRVATYSDEAEEISAPHIIDRLRLDLKGTDVLLIDDVLDTGQTLSKILKVLEGMEAASVKTCVLIDKDTPRRIDFKADFVGFGIPDEFVVGYGLDFAESYRQLPCIGVLKPELQNPPEWG